MLHKYECGECGSICYIESEMWESCPICEETPEERKLKEQAERAERDYEAYRNAAEYWRETALRLEKERDKWKEAHEQRIRHLKSENSEVDRLCRERDELYSALYSLLLEAKCHAEISKYLVQECEEAEQLINRLKGDK